MDITISILFYHTAPQKANELAYEQNDLLDRQNEIVQKAKRDANVASMVGAVQRHNTNKMLRQFKKK